MSDAATPHPIRRIVVTGGPGAGKTAALELARRIFGPHVRVLPEAASILFQGGFVRGVSVGARAAAQRAIFHVQRELETTVDAEGGSPIVLCDRGTVDGFAYWPEATDFWTALGTTRACEHARYDVVIHMRVPSVATGYNHDNPARIESAAEAARIDQRIAAAWEGHPRLFEVERAPDFLDKAQRVIEILRSELPACCQRG